MFNTPNSDVSTSALVLRPAYQRVTSVDAGPGTFELSDAESSVQNRNSESLFTQAETSPNPLLPQAERNGTTNKWESHKIGRGVRTRSDKWFQRNSSQGWRLGVLVGCCASALVLILNVTILLVGAFRYGGPTDGIGTLARGHPKRISWMSTAYHVLINLLSTILLIASNYCMQLLCSPTRDEVNLAHRRGQWLQIGVLSPGNLRYLNKRRCLLWWILALSSFPLHVFYNSAIFKVTIGQDYHIQFIAANERDRIQDLASDMSNLTNDRWWQTYDTQFVPNAGDLYLVIDMVSFDIHLHPNLSWYLLVPQSKPQGQSWTPGGPGSEWINAQVNLTSDGTSTVKDTTSYRMIYDIDTYKQQQASIPNLKWPEPILFNASQTHSIRQIPALGGMDSKFWLSTLPLHVEYALSSPRSNSSSVQIGIYFMIIVIIANAAKSVVMLLVFKDTSTSYLVTTGDAIASFLEKPDTVTVGMCSLDKKAVIRQAGGFQDVKPGTWRNRRNRTLSVISRNEWVFFLIILFIAGSATVLSMIYALPNDISREMLFKWGTSSNLELKFTRNSFDARTVLLNSWLANAPQVLLSISYFSINRLATSMVVAHEWDQFAVSRKALRVTQPVGEQKSTYFLSLPYRWALPLAIMSGILHWLLSQALFLARLEIRDMNGVLKPSGSKCICGYSSISVLVFSMTWISLLIVIVFFTLRQIDQHIPLAATCSLAISAACHPPPNDVEPHLRPVQWGAVRNIFGGRIAHCTFTSEPVTCPKEGQLYA